MSTALTRLRNFCKSDQVITLDEAIAICKKLASKHPELRKVSKRIKGLRKERDLTRDVAQEALSNGAWERSDMKKWADKQRDDPDND